MASEERWPDVENLGFVEELYDQFLRDPRTVDADWRSYFEGLADGAMAYPQRQGESGQGRASIFGRPTVFDPTRHRCGGTPAGNGSAHGSYGDNGNASSGDAARMVMLQDRVDQLVRAYRIRGHLEANLDPLGRPRPKQAELTLAFYGLREADLDLEFSSSTLQGEDSWKLRDITLMLRNTYCRSIGVQFQHIQDLKIKRWLEQRMEQNQNHIALSRERQLRILTWLSDAVMFEEFIQKKFQGAKSFSLEGAESFIPLVKLAIEKAGEQDIDAVIIGMAHRGRLNVLANIVNKSPRDIFHEFADVDPELSRGRGDVKYHLGHSCDYVTESGRPVHLSLCFNPSHLEYVSPVVMGRVRARMDRNGDVERRGTLALLIHGDAAFAGEGVVQETLNLSRLDGYSVGGAVHVIINNQIGFTTEPEDGRSSNYAADIAKLLQIPIFHVNGEDPEAVAQVIDLAMEFRKEYQCDVVIDMYCFRRRGHNEGDEPSFTQPLMYNEIRRRKPVREAYLQHLLELGEITRDEADHIVESRRVHLETELSEARTEEYQRLRRVRNIDETLATAGGKAHTLDPETWAGIWSAYRGGREPLGETVHTAVPSRDLARLLECQTQLPAGFHPNPKIERRMELWREMASGTKPLDWAAGESLAIATLAVAGCRTRWSGQDCQRGTFGHRHSVLHDIEDGHEYMPLAHLTEDQAPVEIWNSPLSEAGVLGFDYGYSLDCPDGLVIWEAQFGDFANSAQVIIDQFIVSAEDKWRRLSGIVLLLPHGHEGMGPEHSSARLERWLVLAAAENIQVVNLTTPAQLFHCLRRQMLRRLRKPLVVMSPKSLLRLPEAVSSMADLAEGHFQKVIPDEHQYSVDAPVRVGRVLMCSGKVYYELASFRKQRARDDVAIIRVEQLYPLVEQELEPALAPYDAGTPVYWVQEEPANMGAQASLRLRFGSELLGRFPFASFSRTESASPATGSPGSHKIEQEELIRKAFGK